MLEVKRVHRGSAAYENLGVDHPRMQACVRSASGSTSALELREAARRVLLCHGHTMILKLLVQVVELPLHLQNVPIGRDLESCVGRG